MSCHKSSKFIVVYSYIRKRRNRPNNISFHLEKEGQNKFKISTNKEILVSLQNRYKRELSKNLPINMPVNYYQDDNPENRPLLTWRAHANNLYTNWLNYYVYQVTPYDLYGAPEFK